MSRIHLSWNDFFLIAALTYSIIVLALKWDRYSGCHPPIQLFLLVDYVTILLVRLAQLLEQGYSDASELTRKIIAYVKYGVIYTFFVGWTIVGTLWFRESGSCLPEHNQYWTCLIWIIMCYIWIVIYLCLRGTMCYFERRSLGVASRFSYISTGLTSREISELPSYAASSELTEKECSICLESYRVGVKVKKLPRCMHIFHVSCIDQWLQRKTTCPLCRLQVKGWIGGDDPIPNEQELMPPTIRRSSQSDFDIPLPSSGNQRYEMLQNPLVINSDPSSSSSSNIPRSDDNV